MSLALLLPGQGSQHVGMGQDLAQRFPAAARVFSQADEILGFPLSRVMWTGPEDELTATKNAQAAILVHSVAVLEVVRDRLGPVAFAAGHSLGEFSAHVAAGTISFEDALTSVRLRGELMYESGLSQPGTMAAVLGLEDDELERACGRVDAGICVPANFNAPGQVVISGDLAGVEQGMAFAKEAGAKKVIALNVSGAFHSPLMESASAGLLAKLTSVAFRDPDYPVVSNVTASPVSSGVEARALLVRQLTSPVRWSASVATMLGLGVDRFIELGPGNVLAGLNRRNARDSESISIGAPPDLEKLGA